MDVSVNATAAATITFEWEPADNTTGDANATDQAILLIYNPAQESFVQLTSAGLRSALTAQVILPAAFAGDEVHTYMSFISANGKQVSDSVYCGQMTVI